jgi:hypothetical protein
MDTNSLTASESVLWQRWELAVGFREALFGHGDDAEANLERAKLAPVVANQDPRLTQGPGEDGRM